MASLTTNEFLKCLIRNFADIKGYVCTKDCFVLNYPRTTICEHDKFWLAIYVTMVATK